MALVSLTSVDLLLLPHIGPLGISLSLSSTALPSEWHIAGAGPIQELARCYPRSCIGTEEEMVAAHEQSQFEQVWEQLAEKEY